MRKIEIFDSETFELIDMSFQYDSVNVVRKFRGVGSIEMIFSSLEEGEKFELGNYVLFNGETYIVENIHKYKDSRGIVKVEVFGNHINRLLEHRVLLPNLAIESGKLAKHYQVKAGETYADVAVRMVQECFTKLVAPYDWGDWLERIAPLDFEASEKTLKADNDYTIDAPVQLTEALNHVLSNKLLGYKITVDYETKKHCFNVYEPKEKDVLFSERLGNINDADFYTSIIDEKTKSIYGSEEAGLYGTKGSNESGFARKELIHTNNTLEWKTSHKARKSASFDIVETGSFTYREDYDLGDIVEYYNETFKIKTQQQIAEVTETYDKFETVSITIGDFIPTIYDRLKGVI